MLVLGYQQKNVYFLFSVVIFYERKFFNSICRIFSRCFANSSCVNWLLPDDFFSVVVNRNRRASDDDGLSSIYLYQTYLYVLRAISTVKELLWRHQKVLFLKVFSRWNVRKLIESETSRHCRIVYLELRKNPENSKKAKFSKVHESTLLSCKTTSWISSISFSITCFPSVKGNSKQKGQLWLLFWNPDRWDKPKITLVLTSGFSNSYFSKTTGLIYSFRASIDSFHVSKSIQYRNAGLRSSH